MRRRRQLPCELDNRFSFYGRALVSFYIAIKRTRVHLHMIGDGRGHSTVKIGLSPEGGCMRYSWNTITFT